MPDPINRFPSANEQQRKVFVHGLSGQLPKIPHDPALLERKAQAKMSKRAFAYIAGGAGLDKTVQFNREDFNQWRVVPRMLRNVADYDLTTEVLGQQLKAPLLLSPIGVLELSHKEADLAVARATSNLGIPMIFSNQASYSMEQCAEVMGDSTRWFQLYWSKSRELVASLVQRAEACGCSAIVVTLDTNLLGWRVQDLDLGSLPFLTGQGIAQYTSDPYFQQLVESEEMIKDAPPLKPKLTVDLIASIISLMARFPGGFFQNLRSRKPLKAVQTFINVFSNAALTWEDIPFLRAHTKLPILLKGILDPRDALRAIDIGVDGIIVSNHGGRQVDGAISAIAALPDIVTAVNGQVPVLMDSGIRTGVDIFKAVALGAKAVCIGRQYVYGLAVDGENGVKEVVENLVADFEVTMRLAGCKTVGEINQECLKKV